jgi:hypothetical protein
MRAFDRRYRHHKPRLHGGGAFTVGQPLRRYNTERTTRDAASPGRHVPAPFESNRYRARSSRPQRHRARHSLPAYAARLLPRFALQVETRCAANSTRSKLDAQQARCAANSTRSKLDAQQTRCAANSVRSKLDARQTRCGHRIWRTHAGRIVRDPDTAGPSSRFFSARKTLL